ncbi:hypothetical protein SARC_14879 [Sphaeroforma arctica JP610]|uniref:Cytochrome c oxidase subunit Vb n=1 Tax=Sphaeroforma arctica JP610 TaxID=667725 RepID=A0A0L0F8Z1_9EUKA|nr:hypothetical protein SARC_14879 [Sphaeroforma arctica JP610]KNC72563.1 hypothetical protein SARC_14879 [Sphaeroforma arctica JP610]|eukprot:XP_014146465.1 hypothetical protein SARC_14879 [Sphaeroforma arctica JP610]
MSMFRNSLRQASLASSALRTSALRRNVLRTTTLRSMSAISTNTAGVAGIVSGDDQAVGLERYQREEFAKGNMDPFFKDLRCYHFGTEENPHLVPSFREDRIIGCTGGTGLNDSPRPHETLWYNVVAGTDLECNECGQVFQLIQLQSPIPIPDGTDMHH